jgi:ParB family chromosome partitioning protein
MSTQKIIINPDTHGLKVTLDAIDQDVSQEVHSGYKQSRLRVLVGAWEKGEAIVNSTPLNLTINFLQLEKETGRARQSLKSWHDLYQKYPDKKKYISEYAEPKAETWAEKALKQGQAALGPHVANNSGENEWYTPAEYVEPARIIMGGIDCDPASSEIANRIIKAKKFYSAQDDGLKQKWGKRVWMNPPYAQPLIAEFCEAVTAKYESGEIEQACVLVNNATETAWFQRMLERASAVCLVRGRIKYLDESGKPNGTPLQGQAILYFGKDWKIFQQEYSPIGAVLHK